MAYFVIPHKFRWAWLLISSYYFYMCWNPKYALLLATVTIVTYISGLLYNLGLDNKEFFVAVISIIIVLVMNLLQRKKDMSLRFSKQNIVFRWLIYVTAIVAILIFGIFAGYDAQQFIYFQF